LDVFDLFNFPRLPNVADPVDNGNTQGLGQSPATDLSAVNAAMSMPNFAVPNPDTDWLFRHST